MRKIDVVPIYEKLRQQLKTGVWQCGEKLPAERELARQFGVARNTLRPVLLQLAQEGLLKRSATAGTVVTAPTRRQNIYYLLPYPDFWEEACNVDMSFSKWVISHVSRIAYDNNCEIRLLYATDDNVYGNINRRNFAVLGSGDIVIIDSMWYLPAIPFLLERQVQGVFIMPPTEELKAVMTPEVLQNFSFILLDRRTGCYEAYRKLYQQGARRIALFGSFLPPEHPERLGFEAACRDFGGDSQLCLDLSEQKVFNYTDHQVLEHLKEFLRQQKFDALILNSLFRNAEVDEWVREIIRLPESFKIFFLSAYYCKLYQHPNNYFNIYDFKNTICETLSGLLKGQSPGQVTFISPQIIQ